MWQIFLGLILTFSIFGIRLKVEKEPGHKEEKAMPKRSRRLKRALHDAKVWARHNRKAILKVAGFLLVASAILGPAFWVALKFYP